MDCPLLTNKDEIVADSDSWFWPVDTHNNVLVDPETLHWTADTWAKFKRVMDERLGGGNRG